jgi:hypothetical protein
MINYSTNKRQEQSKKRERKRWLKWLRNPQMLRLLFQIGIVIFNILKQLYEFWQEKD